MGHIREARGWAGVWHQEWMAWERQELPGTCLEPPKSLLHSEHGEGRNCLNRRCLTTRFHSLGYPTGCLTGKGSSQNGRSPREGRALPWGRGCEQGHSTQLGNGLAARCTSALPPAPEHSRPGDRQLGRLEQEFHGSVSSADKTFLSSVAKTHATQEFILVLLQCIILTYCFSP